MPVRCRSIASSGTGDTLADYADPEVVESILSLPARMVEDGLLAGIGADLLRFGLSHFLADITADCGGVSRDFDSCCDIGMWSPGQIEVEEGCPWAARSNLVDRLARPALPVCLTYAIHAPKTVQTNRRAHLAHGFIPLNYIRYYIRRRVASFQIVMSPFNPC